MNQSGYARVRKLLAPCALIILCCVPFFRGYAVRDQPLKEDEIYWIGQAYYFHLAFEERDWSHPDWQLLPSRENPVLGKYVIGLGLRLGGLSVTNPDWLGVFYVIAKNRPNAWGEDHDRKERQAVVDRMAPTVRDLALNQDHFEFPFAYATVARAVMLVFGVLSVLAVFILATFYMEAVFAFLAALMFSLHPAVVTAYTEVGVDILAIAFSLLAMIGFVLIERTVWRRCSRPGICRALVCIAGGLSLAFAVGSKLNAAVVGIVGVILCLWFAVSFLCHRSGESKDSCAAMILLLAVSLVVFVGSNPLNYPNPAAGIWAGYADQQRSLDVQKGIPTVQHPLRSWSGRFQAVAHLTAFQPAIFGLIAVAFLFQIAQARKSGGPFQTVALWWLLVVAAVTAWIPFARPRYVLPVIAPSVILICSAVGQLFQIGRTKMTRAEKSPGSQ